MSKLVLYPTDLSQWHALVNEAELYCSCQVPEEVESYLVYLLMRFSQQSQMLSSIIGMDFLNTSHAVGKHRIDLLRDVGDKSLLFCGLFPGIAARRRVQVDYFVSMGRVAYYSLSDLEANSMGNLYALLSEQFVILKNILQAMRVVSRVLSH